MNHGDFPPKYLRDRPELLTDAPSEPMANGRRLSIIEIEYYARFTLEQFCDAERLRKDDFARMQWRRCKETMDYWDRLSWFSTHPPCTWTSGIDMRWAEIREM